MKKTPSFILFCILSSILFAQDYKKNDTLQIATDADHTAIGRLIKQNDSIIQLNALYEDSMRMFFSETKNTGDDNLASEATKRKEKFNRQFYFRIVLGVFFLGLLVFRLVKKRKK